VNISILLGGEHVSRVLEPGIPSPDERFKLAKELSMSGFWVGLVAEPVIPGVNDRLEFIQQYVEKAVDAGVRHVNFGPLKVSVPNVAYRRFMERGLDLYELMKGAKGKWRGFGDAMFKAFKSKGIAISSPDWVSFPFESSCEGCCGLDEFGVHHFTIQKALRLLREKGRVSMSDMMAYNIFGGEHLGKFREVWNGKREYFNLEDVEGVRKVGYDDSGNAVYGLVG
jgi:hypothetical protein